MGNNMVNVYAGMSEFQLRELRSNKILRGMKISKDGSWFAIKEKNTLRQQIRWIDAELRCRADQMRLL